MDALATFILQVDPVTVQAEAFVGKAHRAVVAGAVTQPWEPSPGIPINLGEIAGWRRRHPDPPRVIRAPVVVIPPAPPEQFTAAQIRIATAALDAIERKAN
jgi:hypothetical protein